MHCCCGTVAATARGSNTRGAQYSTSLVSPAPVTALLYPNLHSCPITYGLSPACWRAEPGHAGARPAYEALLAARGLGSDFACM
jgi:hypothetical protein